MLVLKLAVATTDTSLPILRPDALLDGDNDGVRFLFDLGSSAGWPGGAPSNGASIADISAHANGSFQLTSGQAVAYAGGGFDFTGLAADADDIVIPASVAASIYGNGSDNQYFLICLYVRLPSSANWNQTDTIAPFIQFNTNFSGYTQGPDLITIAQSFSSPNRILTFRRQTNGLSTVDQVNLTVSTNDHSQVAQIAFWRNGTEQRGRLKTALNTTLTTAGAVGSNNSGNFSTNAGHAGIGTGFWTFPTHANANNWRLYRGWVENLRTSERNPQTVLDADWARVVARNVFS